MLWALAPKDVARLATGRAALDIASGQGLYALLGRGQGEAQRAGVLLVAALSCARTSDHLAPASSLAGTVAEVPRQRAAAASLLAAEPAQPHAHNAGLALQSVGAAPPPPKKTTLSAAASWWCGE